MNAETVTSSVMRLPKSGILGKANILILILLYIPNHFHILGKN